MTCIIALKTKDKIYMGCDSCGSNGHDFGIVTTDKVFIRENNGIQYIFGGTGSFRASQLLEYAFQIPDYRKIDKKENRMQYLVNKFIPELIKCFVDNGYSKIEN